MKQMSVISRLPIFIGFRRLTGCQRDPRDRGVTKIAQKLQPEENGDIVSTMISGIRYLMGPRPFGLVL